MFGKALIQTWWSAWRQCAKAFVCKLWIQKDCTITVSKINTDSYDSLKQKLCLAKKMNLWS